MSVLSSSSISSVTLSIASSSSYFNFLRHFRRRPLKNRCFFSWSVGTLGHETMSAER